jgi:hypothetical protein
MFTNLVNRNKTAPHYRKIFSPEYRLVYRFYNIGALPGKFDDATGVPLILLPTYRSIGNHA